VEVTAGWTSARLASASMHSSMLIPNVMHRSIRCCTCGNHDGDDHHTVIN
jgi:hypothetical protein